MQHWTKILRSRVLVATACVLFSGANTANYDEHRTVAAEGWHVALAGFDWNRTRVGFDWTRTLAGFDWNRIRVGFDWGRALASWDWT